MGFPPYFQITRDLVTSSSGRDRMFIGVFRCLCHHYHYHRGSSALHCNWLQGRSGREKKRGWGEDESLHTGVHFSSPQTRKKGFSFFVVLVHSSVSWSTPESKPEGTEAKNKIRQHHHTGCSSSSDSPPQYACQCLLLESSISCFLYTIQNFQLSERDILQ